MLSICEGSFVKWQIHFGSLLDGTSTTSNTSFQDKGFDPTGWELALVTAPSNTTSSASSSQLVGFFDLDIIVFWIFYVSGTCYGAVGHESIGLLLLLAYHSHYQYYLI
jgi:hypothetical protein